MHHDRNESLPAVSIPVEIRIRRVQTSDGDSRKRLYPSMDAPERPPGTPQHQTFHDSQWSAQYSGSNLEWSAHTRISTLRRSVPEHQLLLVDRSRPKAVNPTM
uniref:(northern house mosquito) hypothetical protein n=1 Tax=Culex pipiens TaxID=7175 RepID=A0A8D8ASA7_CULPI